MSTITLDYVKGWAASSNERNTMVKEAFDELMRSDKPNDFVDITTGDALCIATKRTTDEGDIILDVYDCTVRRYAGKYLKAGSTLPKKLVINNG